jgi:regulator of protease activity HflC (stomatin/prohibitin superfamily)
MSNERQATVWSGWPMLPLTIALYILGPVFFYLSASEATKNAAGSSHPVTWMIWTGIGCLVPAILSSAGFFTLQPNEARVLLLFGEYKGTVRASGFWWGNPFYSNGARQGLIAAQMAAVEAKLAAVKGTRQGCAQTGAAKAPSRHKISLRARTLNGEKLKVNDKRGNPVEIAAIVIWRVQDTAQAAFDVDDYEKYVETQSESALRHLASCYSYDHGEENEITLRSGVEEVSQALRKELQERLAKAGVTVEEARLTHLAYAPEIAQAMLRRQQAEAVIAARQKIVHGAVSMVDMALRELAEKQVVQLDDERKAAMVSNLMVVLCGESEVHPVLNTGTLYT